MLYYLMGKSSSGKDTIYRKILSDVDCLLKPMVPYTTRPIREGEQEGREYHFTDEAGLEALRDANSIIEERCYHTVHGDWYYFTARSESEDIDKDDYIYIGTLESYAKTRDFFGKDRVCPIYIELDDGERLLRAITRERQQKEPRYKELCRRFIADTEDFADEKLDALDITKRFVNEDLDTCVLQIKDYIASKRG